MDWRYLSWGSTNMHKSQKSLKDAIDKSRISRPQSTLEEVLAPVKSLGGGPRRSGPSLGRCRMSVVDDHVYSSRRFGGRVNVIVPR